VRARSPLGWRLLSDEEFGRFLRPLAAGPIHDQHGAPSTLTGGGRRRIGFALTRSSNFEVAVERGNTVGDIAAGGRRI
jgi:hypothetical protein